MHVNEKDRAWKKAIPMAYEKEEAISPHTYDQLSLFALSDLFEAQKLTEPNRKHIPMANA